MISVTSKRKEDQGNEEITKAAMADYYSSLRFPYQ